MPHLEQSEGKLAVSDRRTELAVPRSIPSSEEQAVIGKSLVVKGELTGSGSLYIDGKVEGMISLPGNRVTVGITGEVAANIVAADILVLGNVHGDCQASNRVDIRSGGSLTGNVIAARISIEDGALFKGGIDIRMTSGHSAAAQESRHRAVAVEGSELAASYDARADESISKGRYRTMEDESDVEDALPRWNSSQLAFARSRRQ